MIRWSCQRLHGCVPVRASATPTGRELGQLRPPLAHPLRRLGERLAPAGAHLDLGRDQLADEVLLERRPCAAACSSSKRLTSSSVSRSRSANSSSTATVKSVPLSNASYADANQLVRRQALLVAHRRSLR